jgi:SNF2 family DNA or RNA helicase
VVDSVLVITKKSLIQNWSEEIEKHSFLRPRLLSQDRNANFFAFNSPAGLYLTHYEVLVSEQKRLGLFLKTRRVAAILDEAHKIKNPESGIAKALHRLSLGFCRRVIMTGTPIANRPFDLWSEIRFLDQGASLGNDFASFRRSLDMANDFATAPERAAAFENALEGVFQRIQPFTVRRTKMTAGITLPDKHVSNVLVDLEPRQAEIYNHIREEMSAVVVREGRAVLDDAEEMLKRLLRLVQVASNPALIDESYRADPGKLPVLESMLNDAIDSGSKVVVWTAFTENAVWLARRFDRFGAVYVHGRIRIDLRNDAIKSFKSDDECKLLVATPGAAKEGLTLTVANHAIFYDRSFSLDDYLQAQDRIHRISQDKPCFVRSIVARQTIDEWVDALLAAKHIAAQLGQGDITREEYKEKASYSFGEIFRDVLQLRN